MTRITALAILITAALAGAARAQPAATAEQLFAEGRQAMDAQRYTEACAAFERSQQLEPNVATLMNLANCRELAQQLATALALFVRVQREAAGDPELARLEDTAKRRVARLEPRVSKLTIRVGEGAPAGLAIARDGAEVARTDWNRPLAVDGGSYTLRGTAPGHLAWTATVTVKPEADAASVEVPPLAAAAAPAPAPAPAPEGEGREPVPQHRRVRSRTTALVLGGAAVVALGAAVGFELAARSAYADSERRTIDLASHDALVASGDRRRYAAVGLGIAGAGAAAVATYLWFRRGDRSPDRAVLAPVVSPDGVGLAFARGF